MRNKFLTSVVTSATAVTMVFTPCMSVYATEPQAVTDTVTINGVSDEFQVEVSSITVENGKSAIDVRVPDEKSDDTSVHVTGDVTSSGFKEEGAYSDALGRKYNYSEDAVTTNGGNIDIDGNVNANADEQDGVHAFHGATVTVGGDITANKSGIYADGSGTTVTVEAGDVSAAANGISARNEATVDVHGNVYSTGHDTVLYSKWNPEKNDYDYKKPGTTGDGISTDASANITVDGDVIGTSVGVGIFRGKDTPSTNGNIIVTGTVSASGEGAPDIMIGKSYDMNHETIEYDTVQDILNAVPDITVHALGKGVVSAGLTPAKEEGVTGREVNNKIIEAINYIIKLDPDTVKDYALKLSDENENVNDVTYGEENLKTVNIGKQFKVAASIPEGYEIVGGNNHMDVTDNGDGTFTLKLLDTKGGIYVSAKLRPVPAASSDSSESSGSSQEYQVVVEETAAYADPEKAPAGAIVVNTVSQPTSVTASATPVSAISGDKPARTVSYSISKVTPIQYKTSVIQNVAAAPAGGALNIETDKVTCFDSKMIEAIGARSDLEVNVVFTYGGKKLKVTIPAGYNVKSLLDSNGYCGFLRLLSILGGEEVK